MNADDIRNALIVGLPNYKSYGDAWTELSGYVAEMVREGSEDATSILAFMHELKPSTAIFTGTVGWLREGCASVDPDS